MGISWGDLLPQLSYVAPKAGEMQPNDCLHVKYSYPTPYPMGTGYELTWGEGRLPLGLKKACLEAQIFP